MSDDRPPRYMDRDEDGQDIIVYRASGVGGCPRALTLCGLGYDAMPWPDWFQTVLDEGTNAEDEILRMYELENDTVVGLRQSRFEWIVGRKNGMDIIVRGHVDGFDATATGPLVIEAKKIRKDGWEEFKRRGVEMHTHWLWQVASQQHGTESPVLLVGGEFDPDTGKLTGRIHTHLYSEPVMPAGAIRAKVAKVEVLIDSGKWNQIECKPADYPCRYFVFHDEKPEVPDLSKHQDRDILQVLIDRHVGAGAMEKKLKDQLKLAESEKRSAFEGIKEFLSAQGTEKATFDGKTISIVTVKPYTVKAREQAGYSYVKVTHTKEA